MLDGFLAKVRREKRRSLAARMAAVPIDEMRRMAVAAPPPVSLSLALCEAVPAIIGEVKRRSPSAGDIRAVADPGAMAESLVRGGAAAVSVLTEERHFGGSLEDLRAVRRRVGVPVLRKDFLHHVWELLEARAAGADAVLLIVRFLAEDELSTLLEAARIIGLECLVEVHDERELRKALAAGAGIIGLNNRDLTTLEVDVRTAERLAPLVPKGCLAVGESGYRRGVDLMRAARAGVRAFLVGEALMRSGSAESAVRRMLAAARLSLAESEESG